MDANKLKAIVEEVVNKAVDPIKATLEGHSKILESHSKILNDHTRRLEALSGDVHDLHDRVKALDDKTSMYHFRNKREVDEIKRHLNLPIIPDRPEI
jgi:hypothetical protein